MFGRQVVCLMLHLQLVYSAALKANTSSPVTSSNYDCMYEWLRNIGFKSGPAQDYQQLFAREEISESILRLTSVEQLKELGVTKHGHRMNIHSSLLTTSMCEHDATCDLLTDDTSFQCSCLQGFDGDKCQYVIGCGETVCRNGGNCSLINGSVQCSCASGYTGSCCEHDVCQERPCLHDGVCSHTSDGYHCECTLGYEGRHCETAWLTKNSFQRLSKQVAFLERLQEFTENKSQEFLMRVESLLESSQGPRFFVEQSIIGPQGVIQTEHFNVDNTQYTLFLTNTPTQVQLSGVSIYLHRSNLSLSLLQTITTTSPISVTVFSIQSDLYLLMISQPSTVTLYKWTHGQFYWTQDMRVPGAQAAEYILADNVYSLLVFSCANGHRSSVYLWYDGQFELYQYLNNGGGGRRVHSFESTDHQLFITMTTDHESNVLQWNGTELAHHQQLPSFKDLMPVHTGSLTYLIGVGDHTMSYLLNSESVFVPYSTTPTPGASNALHLHINTEHFIAFGGHSSQVGIYRMDGFQMSLFQTLPITGSLSVFEAMAGCVGLTVSTEQATHPNTHLYTWTSCLL